MKRSTVAGMMAATLLTVAPSAFAQAQTKASDTTTTAQTLTGCLMGEPAYRKAHGLGSGAVGGIGLGDEYVLVDAQFSPAKSAADLTSAKDMPKTSRAEGAPDANTPGVCPDKGMAFRLTGTAEEKLKGLVGKRLEVQGHFKHVDDLGNNGTPESGKLPAEVEIIAFRETAATAAATPVEPSNPVIATTPVAPQPQPQTTTPNPPTMQPIPPPAPTATTPTELPRTASSTELLAVVGLLALFSAGVVMTWRRRAF